MKHMYVLHWRSAGICLIVLWLVALSANLAFAQQKAGVEAGVFRIKVTEALALQLEASRMTRNANNVLVTGIAAIDRANLQNRVSGMQRVFRPAGKFEAKHRRYGLHRWYELKVDNNSNVLTALAAYRTIGGVETAVPVYKKAIIGSERADFGPVRVDMEKLATLPGASNDPRLGEQWHYNNTGQAGGTPGSDISLFQAWGLETGSSNVIVAVTDGGAQVDHPDLAANMWVNVNEIPDNDIDDDNNGYVDDINGYGFGDNTGEIAPDDHGTHTSGTVAATTNNGIGVAGVAGGSGVGDGARIMTLAAFGGVGTGGFEDTYVYGADNGAVISQNSWGYTVPGQFDPAVLEAIDYFIAEAGKDENGNQVGPMRGGIVIFAAGNSDSNEEHYPGFYDATLAVSGVTNQDKKAWYSNYGPWVDIAAPGGETFVANDPHGVLSTVAGGQYAFFQGTSMACPHVSGVAALIVSKFGGQGFTPEMLRGRLTTLVDDIDAADPDFAGLLGSGRLNAFKALQEDDGDAPEAITDLAAQETGVTYVLLSWTSPADPGNGSASVYDIRYSTSPITEANFESATAVADPPAPQPAGTVETYLVSGLAPATTYYFAIKSADFFGNFSAISNVLEQATSPAPQIVVTPTSLEVTLQTAQTTTVPLTISNPGEGVLQYVFDNWNNPDSGSFASPVPALGAVQPGQSAIITVTIDANNKLAGTYEQDLIILTNDPVQDTVIVPVTLVVENNGAPIASVNPTTLDFGDVFDTGSKTLPVTVHNAGSEPLTITGITSDNDDFSTSATTPWEIAPFEDAVIPVTYTADGLGASAGTLSIATNDPANALLTVTLSGQGVEAPGIEVSPESLSATLNTDRSATQTLSVTNTGASDLEFSIAIASGAPVTVSTVKDVSIPTGAARSSSGQKQTASTTGKYSNQIKIRSAETLAIQKSVLIVSPDNSVNDIAAVLNSFADINATIFPVDSLPSITAAQLQGYDIVFTTNNTQWLAGGGVEPEVIGDVLADYIDGGGKVIVNQFAYSYDAWKMEGRFINEQYGPFLPSTTDAIVDVELGEILSPGHPLLEGVQEIFYSGFVQNVGLAPGATAVAAWDDGELLIAANGNVVALNLLPSLGNGDPLQWAGDLPTLYQNAVHYLAGPTFVDVAPRAGTVAPGEQLDLEVTFDATGLDAGVYEASININNNVPNNELVAVPATLTVLGPEFTVAPESLYQELENNETATQTLVLSNNGPDNHTYSVSVEGGITPTSVKVKKTSKPAAPVVVNTAEKIRQNSAGRKSAQKLVKEARSADRGNARMAARLAEAQTAALYATDFESFDLGDVSGQDGWFGQFANWTIDDSNPSGGSQHYRGLADGLGESASVSPNVGIGSDAKSTVSMKLNVQGTGVTWQLIPQSPAAGFINLALEFEPDGSIFAFSNDGSGGGLFEQVSPTTPSGYFDLTIVVDRDSAYFDVYFDNDIVYSGLAFSGDIEEMFVVSLMEEAGPTLDIDDFQLIDGLKTADDPFLTVSPSSGNLPAGASVELTVEFAADDRAFGLYASNINIAIDTVATLVVPASLRVVGDPAIEVDPTVLQATVDYRESTTQTFAITNTGGRPLEYALQVVGAATDVAKLPKTEKKFSNWASDKRIVDKKAIDDRTSKPRTAKAKGLEVLTGTALLQENFDGGAFPSGWSVVDNEGSGVVWGFAADAGEDNYAGTGEAATASSDVFGVGEYNTELITPAIATAGYKNIVVQYNANYQNLANRDYLNLDIQVDGGAWQNVLSWNEDHGTFRGTPGEFVNASLAGFLSGAASFRLRWHYYDPETDDWDWYAQIDDVVVLGDARAWLSVEPAAGTVPVGETAQIEALFDASDVEAGSYVAGILVSSNAVEDPLVGIVAMLTVREPAVISVEPDSLSEVLFAGATAQQTLTISNSGESALKFSFGNTPVPTAVPSGADKARVQPVVNRTVPVATVVGSKDTRAIRSHAARSASTGLYVTGFEEFAPGDINGQENWEGTWGNWTVEAEAPFEGAQHFRGLADGLGESLAFSPLVAIGEDPISSVALQLNVVGTGVTWEVIPQSPTAEFVNTRFRIAPDNSLSALAIDSSGTADYWPIDAALPEGYFELRIDVVRATSEFTIYIDGTPVFTGTGFAGDIEQVVLYSLMEEADPTFDIDNLAIYDGPAVAPWLTVNPKSGIVPAGGSATVTVTFDAHDLEAGVYQDTLRIRSNDPATPQVYVPATLTVIDNVPPVLTVSDTSVIELGSLDVTFTATDPDGEPVTIVLDESLSFITPLGSSDGSASYRIRPLIGHAGEYELPVIATDARGATTTEIFHLSVVAYGVESFSLSYLKTGVVVETFTDTLWMDVAQPDFHRLTIRANTNPAEVGSVRFHVDGVPYTLNNKAPYDMDNDILVELTPGAHSVKADAYTRTRERGDKGKSLEATLIAYNSGEIVALEVVRKTNAAPLLTLEDGSVIDLTNPAFADINIRASGAASNIKSVVFELNGAVFRTDSKLPFVLNGNASGKDVPWPAEPGSYTLTATPYAQVNGQGIAGTSLTVTFQVTNGADPAAATARAAAPAEESAEEEGGEPVLSLYPVPVEDDLHVQLKGKVEGEVGLTIRDIRGVPVFSEQGKAAMFRDYHVSTVKIGMVSGFYLVQIQYANGKREMRKIIKR